MLANASSQGQATAANVVKNMSLRNGISISESLEILNMKREDVNPTSLSEVPLPNLLNFSDSNNILKQMMEEPELEAKASYLAMLLSVLILSGGKEVKPDMLESWIALFLPSLEKRDEISWSLYTLFYVGSRHFATWMSQVREALQSRILGAIGSALPTLSPKDLTYAKSLLVKVPELFVRHAKNVTEWESKSVPVTINGKVMLLNVLFDALKRIESPTEAQIDAFADVFVEFVRQRSFTECIGMDLVSQIMTHLANKRPEFVDSFYQNLEPPGRYSALFLRQRHGLSLLCLSGLEGIMTAST